MSIMQLLNEPWFTVFVLFVLACLPTGGSDS